VDDSLLVGSSRAMRRLFSTDIPKENHDREQGYQADASPGSKAS
jgi:hypothetical protein